MQGRAQTNTDPITTDPRGLISADLKVLSSFKTGLTRQKTSGNTTGPQSLLKPHSSIMRVRRV